PAAAMVGPAHRPTGRHALAQHRPTPSTAGQRVAAAPALGRRAIVEPEPGSPTHPASPIPGPRPVARPAATPGKRDATSPGRCTDAAPDPKDGGHRPIGRWRRA